MDTKICSKCGQEKNLDDFGFRNKDRNKRHGVCISCNRKHNRNHYRQNLSYYKKKAKIWSKSTREICYENLYQYLCNNPCVDCGEVDPVLLQFDHLRDKQYEISVMISRAKIWSEIENEISKCQVLCVKCHTLKTAKERNTWMYKRTRGTKPSIFAPIA